MVSVKRNIPAKCDYSYVFNPVHAQQRLRIPRFLPVFSVKIAFLSSIIHAWQITVLLFF